ELAGGEIRPSGRVAQPSSTARGKKAARPAKERSSRARVASAAGTTSFTPPMALLSQGWTPRKPASRRVAGIPFWSSSSRAISACVGRGKVATTRGSSDAMREIVAAGGSRRRRGVLQGERFLLGGAGAVGEHAGHLGLGGKGNVPR